MWLYWGLLSTLLLAILIHRLVFGTNKKSATQETQGVKDKFEWPSELNALADEDLRNLVESYTNYSRKLDSSKQKAQLVDKRLLKIDLSNKSPWTRLSIAQAVLCCISVCEVSSETIKELGVFGFDCLEGIGAKDLAAASSILLMKLEIGSKMKNLKVLKKAFDEAMEVMRVNGPGDMALLLKCLMVAPIVSQYSDFAKLAQVLENSESGSIERLHQLALDSGYGGIDYATLVSLCEDMPNSALREEWKSFKMEKCLAQLKTLRCDDDQKLAELRTAMQDNFAPHSVVVNEKWRLSETGGIMHSNGFLHVPVPLVGIRERDKVSLMGFFVVNHPELGPIRQVDKCDLTLDSENVWTGTYSIHHNKFNVKMEFLVTITVTEESQYKS